jgi:hypothetical protein
MANPYYIQPANPLQALMAGVQGYDRSLGLAKQGEQDQARKLAEEALASGDTRSAIARLIGANDPKSAAVLSSIVAAQNASNGVYGTPIYGKDKNGNTVIQAIGKNGTLQTLDSGGITPTPGVQFLNTGTSFIPMDKRTGAPVGSPVSINNVQTAEEKKFGTEQGSAKATLASLQSKLPGLQTVVAQLGELAKKATYTSTGRALDTGIRELGMSPRESAIARSSYMAKVNNQILPMLRDTFGAQFTEREGATLRETLGDANKTPQEKQAVLNAFIEQKVRDITALQGQVRGGQSMNLTGPGTTVTGVDVSPNMAPQSPGTTSTGVKWRVVK